MRASSVRTDRPYQDATDPVNELMHSVLFNGLEKEAIRKIVEIGHFKKVPSKGIIIREGEKAEHLFLLSTGQAKLYRLTKTGDEILLKWLIPGDIFGLGTILKEPFHVIGTAEALSDCGIYVWEHSTVRKLAAAHSHLFENVLQIILLYVNNYATRHMHVAGKSAEERLAQALTNLADQTGRVLPIGIEVDITNEQLSALAHISSFTASRLLSRWSREGTIAKRRQHVLLRVPEALVYD